MATNSINFNDLKGDNITEIIKYLNPNTEENKKLKKELTIYRELFKNVKDLMEKEYEEKDWHTVWRRKNIKRKISKNSSQILTNIDRLLKECLHGRRIMTEAHLKVMKEKRDDRDAMEQHAVRQLKASVKRRAENAAYAKEISVITNKQIKECEDELNLMD
jgi:hypothetical protein